MNDEKRESRVASDKSEIVAKIPKACSDETAAVEFMEEQRWNGEVACPSCGVLEVYQMKDRQTGQRNRRFLWRCKGCLRQVTVRTGTVFEDSKIPLMHWCYAFWAACASQKGVSALQIKRQTGLTYKSALFMMHRIRYAMAEPAGTTVPLMGTVEADETYVGGKPRYKGQSKRGRGTRKAPVVALVERGGNVRAVSMERIGPGQLQAAIRQHVDPKARIITDDFNPYKGIARYFGGGHETVKHSAGEYVRGDVHTNTVEGFFAIVKRGMMGVFHSVSKRHLHRYLSEFQFRYNTRKIDDGARMALAIKMGDGKRLLYRESYPGLARR